MDTLKENLSLAQTIKCLAAANQQLATAYNFTFDHFRNILTELSKSPDESTKNVKPRLSTRKKKTSNRLLNKQYKKRKRLRDETQNQSDFFKEEPAAKNEVEQNEEFLHNHKIDDEQTDKKMDALEKKLKELEYENSKLLAERDSYLSEKTNADKEIKDKDEKINKLKAELVVFKEERNRSAVTMVDSGQAIHSMDENIIKNDQQQDTVKMIDHAGSTMTMEEFQHDLLLKREARQQALANISSEMERLKRELQNEKIAHSETVRQMELLKSNRSIDATDSDETENCLLKLDDKAKELIEALRLSDLIKISNEVMNELRVQLERTDDLRFQLENNPDEHRLRIHSLKQLSEETRSNLIKRIKQVNSLKDKLARSSLLLENDFDNIKKYDIKRETEYLVQDIGKARTLSNERSRILLEIKDINFQEIKELRSKLENCKESNLILEEDLNKTEDKVNGQGMEILNLESQLGLTKAECRDLQNQMTIINSLFTQMLLGASSAEMNLDRLTELLQENHDLISDIAKANGTEAAALPKLLLDIIEQVDGRDHQYETKKEDTQEENIANNLPKVWRVLLELLSCHATKALDSTAKVTMEPSPDSCYKSVETPSGTRLVISVSKTYIRLKDLILEKKHLEKEMNRMKQLNCHLENKLSEQEKRLSTVSNELNETWGVVGHMQVQHQQLHTHEKILRYELQQKRKMLQELKKELEYCREKWASARQKNNNTEIEWRTLRREFAARKSMLKHGNSFNNSGESGFSDSIDEGESDEDEDNESKVRPIILRKRYIKDASRSIIPDIESEQQTDCEIFEESQESSSPGERNLTPESEIENNVLEMNGNFQFTPNITEPLITENQMINQNDNTPSNVIESSIDTKNINTEVLVFHNNLSDSSHGVPAINLTSNYSDDGNIKMCNPSSTTIEDEKFDLPNIIDNLETLLPAMNCDNNLIEQSCHSNDNSCEAEENISTLPEVSSQTSEMLDARAVRLQNLERQAEWLVKKVNDTNKRGSDLNTRLEKLHGSCGPMTPLMPDILPSSQLPEEPLVENDRNAEDDKKQDDPSLV
ncbi:golgin subfamily B member 1 [Trichogramma pretiosum]|uniref:golgin subfamily B member 1 n=1 Tax=Trichogramma pretiosum TaxID=7493 RepID=UPI0006C94E04|nr:golgin subfamily B member 1 [Trichogramma pretiosum]XP_014229256.1 golgin subfamily B member 1 [Trichogramma pretiosum]